MPSWPPRGRSIAICVIALQGHKVISPGAVARVCAETQRRFFTSPDLTKRTPKWARKGGSIKDFN